MGGVFGSEFVPFFDRFWSPLSVGHVKWLVEMVTLKAILFSGSAANWPKTAGRNFVESF